MPEIFINGEKKKVACGPCIRGHRSTKCNHKDRVMIEVRKPGRPLSACPHPAGSCSCERLVINYTIPKTSDCACPSSHASTPVGTPGVSAGRVQKKPRKPTNGVHPANLEKGINGDRELQESLRSQSSSEGGSPDPNVRQGSLDSGIQHIKEEPNLPNGVPNGLPKGNSQPRLRLGMMGVGGYRAPDEVGWKGDWPQPFGVPESSSLHQPQNESKKQSGCCSSRTAQPVAAPPKSGCCSTSRPQQQHAAPAKSACCGGSQVVEQPAPPQKSCCGSQESSARPITPRASSQNPSLSRSSSNGPMPHSSPATPRQMSRPEGFPAFNEGYTMANPPFGYSAAPPVSPFVNQPGFSYHGAQPHGAPAATDSQCCQDNSGFDHNCLCGDGCSCLGCVTHPQNQTTMDYVLYHSDLARQAIHYNMSQAHPNFNDQKVPTLSMGPPLKQANGQVHQAMSNGNPFSNGSAQNSYPPTPTNGVRGNPGYPSFGPVQTPTAELEQFHFQSPVTPHFQQNGAHHMPPTQRLGNGSMPSMNGNSGPGAHSMQAFEQHYTGSEPPHHTGDSPGRDSTEEDTPTLSPSSFFMHQYVLPSCDNANGTCMCGEGCTCDGCLTHGGHNGMTTPLAQNGEFGIAQMQPPMPTGNNGFNLNWSHGPVQAPNGDPMHQDRFFNSVFESVPG